MVSNATRTTPRRRPKLKAYTWWSIRTDIGGVRGVLLKRNDESKATVAVQIVCGREGAGWGGGGGE